MKKFGILLLSLCLTTSAFADFWTNCTNNGGTIIQANSYGNDKGGLCNDPSDSTKTNNCNGKRFCLSGNAMNWWSNFTWCESIGGRLASFSSLCPGIQTNINTSTGACPNLVNVATNKWGNSNLGKGSDYAFSINLGSGAIHASYPHGYRTNGPGQNQHSALCEE